MSDRDELAKVIVAAYGEDAETECPCEQDLDVADAILAAGYRKPRTLTTVIDLAVLGESAVVLDANSVVWVNDGDQAQPWASVVEDPQGPIWSADSDIPLPATVLYEPQP